MRLTNESRSSGELWEVELPSVTGNKLNILEEVGEGGGGGGVKAVITAKLLELLNAFAYSGQMETEF